MLLHVETGDHVAKRPRVDFHNSAAVVIPAGVDGRSAAKNSTTVQTTIDGNAIIPQHYIDKQLTRGSRGPELPNHILHFTVFNPTYPITCEVLHTICSPIGNVLRIVIFKKKRIQAMVEFDALETAKSAKYTLNGCDIYSGCCTLKIEYAKQTKLNVYINNSDSWDYTNPNLGKERHTDMNVTSQPVSQRRVLLKDPLKINSNGSFEYHVSNATLSHAGARIITENSIVVAQNTSDGLSQQNRVNLADTFGLINAFGAPAVTTNHQIPQQRNIKPATANVAGLNSLSTSTTRENVTGTLLTREETPIISTPLGLNLTTTSTENRLEAPLVITETIGALTTHSPGSVCMVYGLNADRMNANRIFNLFCLYGNVVRIKFLKTIEGGAMVQMGDSLAAERVVSYLNNTSFFGTKMQLGFSKQAFLSDVQTPYQLVDGTPSFRHFIGNKNNRFINPTRTSKNRIVPPSKILHFFNTPPDLKSKAVEEIFTEQGSPAPECVQFLPSKTERSSSGLIEFKTLEDALEALISCNHQPVPNPNGKFPYIMKLCFSSSR